MDSINRLKETWADIMALREVTKIRKSLEKVNKKNKKNKRK